MEQGHDMMLAVVLRGRKEAFEFCLQSFGNTVRTTGTVREFIDNSEREEEVKKIEIKISL